MGILGTILGAGAMVGKICGAFASTLSDTNEERLTMRYTDRKGQTHLLSDTGLSIGDGSFITSKNETTGKVDHLLFNRSSENALEIARANVDDIKNDDPMSESLLIEPTAKGYIEPFYANPHYPVDTFVQVVPVNEPTTFRGNALAAGGMIYTASFKNLVVDSENVKSGSYFQLNYIQGALFFSNVTLAPSGMVYLRVTAHNGIAFSNEVELPVVKTGNDYHCKYSFSEFGIKSGDVVDIDLRVLFGAAEVSKIKQLQKKRGLKTALINEHEMDFISELHHKF
ncbi:hypothetical protein EFM21_01480 [Leuconostoc falkenbergense]|uniref:hypothetical protein n=1 Tax=Leuconostoc falkenbergense TaxID=2766470 RepID=UPI0021A9FF6A|nr:hypothetical protein [Leuconostoc falkenbergense]MCT4377847.1 hypothetical protein [Leuconostoc falkenbergense]MDV8952019.1 hypothetical protein [Leuconostoc falkenbergense]